MTAPSVEDVQAYLESSGIENDDADDRVTSAYWTERTAQAAVCTVPDDGEAWPADLVEALKRRVAVNLTVRGLPLGVQASITEAAVGITRVGGSDREVDRLEGPYRSIAIA